MSDKKGDTPTTVQAVQTPKQHPQLMSLSTELLHLVLDHLDFSVWLQPLLLVSKEFYELTLPHIYRRLDWPVPASSVGRRLIQMLSSENRGLSLVRELVLWDDGESSHNVTEMFDYPEAALLVYMLPRDILTNFEWNSWNSMPSHIYRTLLSRQHALTSLELNWSEIPIDDMLKNGSTSLLSSFEKVFLLKIMPGFGESIPRAAYDVFRNHPEIRDLVLRYWHIRSVDEQHQDPNAAQTTKGDLKSLFKGLGPSTFCLRSLDLARVDLRGCHCDWLSALNFQALSELILLNCVHPQDFLKAVSKATENSPLRLTDFTLYESQDWGPSTRDLLVGEVNHFLRGISKSLRTLWICLRGFDTLPDAVAVAQHGNTLRWLFIDVREQKGPSEVTYPLADWQTLCRSLDRVRQVDVVYPSVEADCQIREHEEFYDYVVSLLMSLAALNIPSLEFLGINNWPSLIFTGRRGSWTVREPNKMAYEQLLARLATDILDLSCSNLAAVVFGILEEITGSRHPGFGRSQMCFGRSGVEVLGGEKKMKMEPVRRWILDRQTNFERKEYDIDALAHEVGQWEADEDL
ncbi:MAG: hypothetical protein Q9216_005446 [Gyalolechia sp. 2 TL-2023]